MRRINSNICEDCRRCRWFPVKCDGAKTVCEYFIDSDIEEWFKPTRKCRGYDRIQSRKKVRELVLNLNENNER